MFAAIASFLSQAGTAIAETASTVGNAMAEGAEAVGNFASDVAQGVGDSFTTEAQDFVVRDSGGATQWGQTVGRTLGHYAQSKSKTLGLAGDMARGGLFQGEEGASTDSRKENINPADNPEAFDELPVSELEAPSVGAGAGDVVVDVGAGAGDISVNVSGTEAEQNMQANQTNAEAGRTLAGKLFDKAEQGTKAYLKGAIASQFLGLPAGAWVQKRNQG